MRKEELKEIVEYTIRLPPEEFFRILDDIVNLIDSLNDNELRTLIEVILEKLNKE
ncbi:MAG: hypothetical protein QXO72_04250 [Sulfolobales archaeon]